MASRAPFNVCRNLLTTIGSSGTPVLRRDDLVSIGTHAYGGSVNSASVIGKFGNPYADYIAAFDLPISQDGVQLLGVPLKKTDNFHPVNGSRDGSVPRFQPGGVGLRNEATIGGRGGHRGSNFKLDSPTVMDEQEFMDTLKSAMKVGAPIAVHRPSLGGHIALGAIGAPVCALAGFTLTAAAAIAQSAARNTGEVTNLRLEGAIERAVLADAALTAYGNLESQEHRESVFADMRDIVSKAMPTIRKVAPYVMPSLTEPALRIALDSLPTLRADDEKT